MSTICLINYFIVQIVRYSISMYLFSSIFVTFIRLVYASIEYVFAVPSEYNNTMRCMGASQKCFRERKSDQKNHNQHIPVHNVLSSMKLVYILSTTIDMPISNCLSNLCDVADMLAPEISHCDIPVEFIVILTRTPYTSWACTCTCNVYFIYTSTTLYSIMF